MNGRFPSITALAVFALAGCGGDTKNEPKTGYAVDELADQAVWDKAAFMGKEAVVHGYTSATNPG